MAAVGPAKFESVVQHFVANMSGQENFDTEAVFLSADPKTDF